MSRRQWHGKGTKWIDIIEPSREDIEALAEAYPQFHPLALEDCLSPVERPKLDEFEDHLFLVLQFPVWGGGNRISHYAEIDLFFGGDFVVSVHDGASEPLAALAREVEQSEELQSELLGAGGSHMAHALIDRLVDELLPRLSGLDRDVRAYADAIFAEDARQILRELLLIHRDLIGLRRNLRAQIAILTSLEEEEHDFVQRDLGDYFGDILDHLIKALDLVLENLEFLDSLSDMADTIVSQRINDVMRTLTVLSVIMLPLTLITGFYGMNVPLPFQKTGASLWAIALLMVAVVVGMLLYFRRKKWL